MKKWLVNVVHHSDLGNVDIDYKVDTMEEVYRIIQQGPGLDSVKTITVQRLSYEELTTVERLYEKECAPPSEFD